VKHRDNFTLTLTFTFTFYRVFHEFITGLVQTSKTVPRILSFLDPTDLLYDGLSTVWAVCTVSNDKMIMNDEFGTMREKLSFKSMSYVM